MKIIQKNKKLTIAVIDMDSLKNSHWGSGQARATREVFKRLADKHNITVYCSKYPHYKDYQEDGINYVHVGIESRYARLTNLMFLFTIPFLVRKIKADIIIENFNAPISVSFAPLFTKTPIIAIPTMFNAIEFTKKYHIPFHWIEALGIKFYRYMVAYSDIDSAKINRLNSKIQYRIIPQGVGEEFFAMKQKKPKHILFLGRLDIWQKGIDLLLHSYAKVKNDIPYPLVIAGHGPDESKIIKTINELSLSDKVYLVGGAYGKKKNQLISEALFVAFPSRHDELSLWALEALASGLPLVTFDLPEGRWLTAGASLKVKPFDIEQYGKLLLKASANSLNMKMRTSARLLAKKYSWEKVAALYDAFIVDVINETRLA